MGRDSYVITYPGNEDLTFEYQRACDRPVALSASQLVSRCDDKIVAEEIRQDASSLRQILPLDPSVTHTNTSIAIRRTDGTGSTIFLYLQPQLIELNIDERDLLTGSFTQDREALRDNLQIALGVADALDIHWQRIQGGGFSMQCRSELMSEVDQRKYLADLYSRVEIDSVD